MKSINLQRGFSLVELVLTMILISILSAVSMSAMMNMDTNEDGSARQQTLSVFRNAQKFAIARRTNVYIIISSNNVKACYDAACTQKVVTLDGSQLMTDTFSNKFNATNSTISYNANGDAAIGTVITIGSLTLTVESGAGYAY